MHFFSRIVSWVPQSITEIQPHQRLDFLTSSPRLKEAKLVGRNFIKYSLGCLKLIRQLNLFARTRQVVSDKSQYFTSTIYPLPFKRQLVIKYFNFEASSYISRLFTLISAKVNSLIAEMCRLFIFRMNCSQTLSGVQDTDRFFV